MPKNLILVDASNVGLIAQHSGNQSLPSGMNVHAIHGVLTKLRDLVTSYSDYEVIMLFDGYAKFRYEMHADYKSDRKKNKAGVSAKAEYKKQEVWIKRLCAALGVTCIHNPVAEADDIAGYYVRFKLPDDQIILVSNDSDWCQLISESVSVISAKGMLNLSSIPVNFDVENPRDIITLKALAGDSGDSICPVGGIGEGGAVKLIKKHSSPEVLSERYQELSPVEKSLLLPTAEANLLNNLPKTDKFGVEMGRYDRYLHNRKMIDLTGENLEMIDWKLTDTKLGTDNFCLDDAQALVETFNFHSAARNFEIWSKPFANHNRKSK